MQLFSPCFAMRSNAGVGAHKPMSRAMAKPPANRCPVRGINQEAKECERPLRLERVEFLLLEIGAASRPSAVSSSRTM